MCENEKKFVAIHSRRQSVLNWIIGADSTVVEPTKYFVRSRYVLRLFARYARIVWNGCLYICLECECWRKQAMYIVVVRAHTQATTTQYTIAFLYLFTLGCGTACTAREQSFNGENRKCSRFISWRNVSTFRFSVAMWMYRLKLEWGELRIDLNGEVSQNARWIPFVCIYSVFTHFPWNFVSDES